MTQVLYDQLLLACQVETAILFSQYLLANLALFLLATLVNRGKIFLMALGMTCGILGFGYLSSFVETFVASDLSVIRKARQFGMKVEFARPNDHESKGKRFFAYTPKN